MRHRPKFSERTIAVILPEVTHEALLSLSVAVGKAPSLVVASMLVASTPALVSLARVVSLYGVASVDRVGGLESAIRRIITDASARDVMFDASVAGVGTGQLSTLLDDAGSV